MAMAHQRWPLYGVQFHPESILTEGGYELLANFLRLAGIALPAAMPCAATERPENPPPFQLPTRPWTF
jgi:hypothetical protein